jgi:hypothetical protein
MSVVKLPDIVHPYAKDGKPDLTRPISFSDVLLELDPKKIDAMLKYLQFAQKFWQASCKRASSEKDFEELKGKTELELQRLALADVTNRPVFVHPYAPLVGVAAMEGNLYVADRATMMLPSKGISVDLCSVAELVDGTYLPSVLQTKLEEYSLRTQQGIIKAVPMAELGLVNFYAPLFTARLLSPNNTVELKPKASDSGVREKRDWVFSPGVGAVDGDIKEKEDAGMVQNLLDQNMSEERVQAFCDKINKMGIQVPVSADLFLTIASALQRSFNESPSSRWNFLVPKGKMLKPRAIAWPMVWDADAKRMPSRIYDGNGKPLFVSGASHTWTGSMTAWVNGYHQHSYSSLDSHFYGHMANFGRNKLTALYKLELAKQHGIEMIVCDDADEAVMIKTLDETKKVYLMGAVCRDSRVVVTGYSELLAMLTEADTVLLPGLVQIMHNWLAVAKYRKMLICFPNLDEVNQTKITGHASFLTQRKIEHVGLLPWNSRPTPYVVFGSDNRQDNKLLLMSIVHCCNSLALRVATDFSYLNFLAYTVKGFAGTLNGRFTWRSPPIVKESLTKAYQTLTQKSRRMAESLLTVSAMPGSFKAGVEMIEGSIVELDEGEVLAEVITDPSWHATKKRGLDRHTPDTALSDGSVVELDS